MFKWRQIVVRPQNWLMWGLLPMLIASKLTFAINAKTSITPSNLAILKQARMIGALAPNTEMHVLVWLKIRNKDKLNKTLKAIYDSHSPHYQQFLNTEQFNTEYAPAGEHVQTVQHYFATRGFTTKQKNSFLIEVTGTTSQIENIFHVKINRYLFQGKPVYSNTIPPTISSEIAPYIAEISGLSNFPRFKPHYLQHTSLAPLPTYLPTQTSLAGFSGAELQTAYNIADIPLVNGNAIDGTGQTIVLVDGCTSDTPDKIMSDANHYIGATPSLQPLLTYQQNFVVVDSNFNIIPPTSQSCSQDGGWGLEISLDVQASHTMAPGAKIVLVIDDNLDEANIINEILSNTNHSIGGFTNANVISNSWGAVETSSTFPSFEVALQRAAAQGLSVNFSTGDCGDDTDPQGTCGNPPFPTATSTPSVNYPASSSWSTAVGGTSLFVDSNWNYSFESGWGHTNYISASSTPIQFFAGCGGGISQLYTIPTWQQSSILGYEAGGYSNPVSSFRALPDVAMLADNDTGLIIYNSSAPPDGCSGFCSANPVGGTSLASPLFSGVLTMVNQVRKLQGKSLLGAAAPYLYNKFSLLASKDSLNSVIQPHQVINGAISTSSLGVNDAPPSAFAFPVGGGDYHIFSWNSSLTIEPNTQFWNDVVGVGTPNVPNFVIQMAGF